VYFTVTSQVTLSAASAYVGDQITVSGTGFYPSSTVTIYFDSAAVTTTTASYSGTFSVVLTVPSTYGGSHTITASDGYSSSYPTSFTIFSKVTVSPALAAVGDKITISGTGFAASQSETIYFDDETAGSAQTNSVGAFSLTNFTVPASAWGSHTIKVQDIYGSYATASFSTKASATLSPTSGPIGTKVTLTGAGFIANQVITLTFDDTAIATTTTAPTTNSKGSFSATVDIPASSGGVHQIKASDGTNIETRTFTVSATMTASPTSGYVGSKVTVGGSGFLANASVSISFNNVVVIRVTADANGSFSTSFEVPAQGAGTYKIKVTDGANTKEADFTVLTTATISPATSTSSPGYVGMAVTVNGVGFMAGRTVTITYDGKSEATGTVGSDGRFTLTFNAPAGRAGAHAIIATDGTNSIPLTFVMEAVPPSVPALSTPAADTKVKAQALFDWATVTDPSGVTYTLQIAANKEFASGSLVLEKAGLTQSEYTLTKDEKLKSVSKKNPYYWRVKATDGALNESSWSEARSFYAGFSFSTAVLIYIIIGIAAVVLILLAFWLGMRRGTRSV
jgi:hypothetical protein